MMFFFGEYNRNTDFVDITSDYHIKRFYGVISADASNGDIYVYFPKPYVGRQYSVQKSDNSNNRVILSFGDYTCNGDSELIIENQYDCPKIISNKDDWIIS